jgi:hypothetical protein
MMLPALSLRRPEGTKGLFSREETKVEVESDYARFFDPARISNPNGVGDTFATRMIVERLPAGCCLRFTVCVDNETGPDGIPISSVVVHKIVMPVKTVMRNRQFITRWLAREGLDKTEAQPPPIGDGGVVILQ